CRDNICLPIRTHYCLNSFSACNKTKISGFCTNSTCTNIIKGLKYIIHHNVHFDWSNTNKSKVFIRSGNPGYVIGKPIIIGLSRMNESNEILFNKSNAFLTLPLARRNGECSKHIVAFGEDIKLRCFVKLFTKNFTTSSCTKLQNMTLHLLMKDSLLNASQHYSVYVSKLGNVTTKYMDWLRITFDNIPQNVVTAHILGKQISCSGLVTSVHLDVLYSILPKTKTLMNYKILGVGVMFGKEKDITWPKCTTKNCTNILHVDI
ncbi:hypothetical protein EAI_02735, partial [Harpegnathos saltator]